MDIPKTPLEFTWDSMGFPYLYRLFLYFMGNGWVLVGSSQKRDGW